MTQKHLEKFLLYFLIFLIVESIVLISLINTDLFVYKFLINYLIAAAAIPFLFEKIKTGKVDPFSPLAIFTFFYLLLFGFRAIDQVIFNREAIIADEIYYIKSMVYAIIGLHFFQIGYFTSIGRKLAARIGVLNNNWSLSKIKIVAITYSLISVLSFALILKLSGGLSFYFSNIRDAMVEITSGSTVFFILVLLIKVPLLIWFSYLLDRRRFSFLFFVYLLFGSFLLMSLGERGHLLTLIISLLIIFHYFRRRIRLIMIAVFSGFLIISLVGLGQYRDFTEKSHTAKKAGFKIKFGIETVYHYFIGHFDQLRHTKDVVKNVPDEVGLQCGQTYLSMLVKPIPSAIWDDKPQGAGRIITKTMYPKAYSLNVSVAPSILAELYLNFHIPGIIAGMLLFGIIASMLKYYVRGNSRNKNVIILYAFLAPYIFSEIRGDFLVVTSFMIFNVIFLMIALIYISNKRIL